MSSLPTSLSTALDEEISRFPYSKLQKAAEELSRRYRQQVEGHMMWSEIDRLAYVAMRLPATYAVVKKVLEETHLRMFDAKLETLLDLGAGPGTVMWAAQAALPHLKHVTEVEQDEELIALGQRLAAHNPSSVQWMKQDITHLPALEPHDVVVLSYVIGELSQEALETLLLKAWQLARQTLVIIEPGTPHHFVKVLQARTLMIQAGAFLVAPCPHALQCPLAAAGDWCHFYERVERSRLHRQLKAAELGYEDEKYSYIVAAKVPGESYPARIVRAPQRHSGHVEFQLCTAEGLKHKTLSRRDKENYKKARKLDWGDILTRDQLGS